MGGHFQIEIQRTNIAPYRLGKVGVDDVHLFGSPHSGQNSPTDFDAAVNEFELHKIDDAIVDE